MVRATRAESLAMNEESKGWIVEFQNGQWTAVAGTNPWLATTKNYFAADGVAKRANQLKLKWTEWTRVFDMLREMDARLLNAANEQQSKSADTITYRLAVWDDEESILAVFKEVAPEIPIPSDDAEAEGKMITEIVQCRGGSWVAVDESGEVVGFALTRPDLRAKDRATALKYIGVTGNSRGLRISSNLMSELRAKGLPLTASVLSGNQSDMADRLVRFGFTKIDSDDKETKFRWEPPKLSSS
jgi:hypothetical protein